MLGVSCPGYAWGGWCATARRTWPGSSTRACLARLAGPLSTPPSLGRLPGDGPAFLGGQAARPSLAALSAPRPEQFNGAAKGMLLSFGQESPARPSHAARIGDA